MINSSLVRGALICLLVSLFVPYGRGVLGQPVRVSFAVTGDIMQHDSQIAAARDSAGGYDYSACFSLVAPLLREVDIALGNLELTFGGSPYRGYPAFSAPDTLAYALREAGFDIVSTANNHSCDRGSRGILRTLSVLDSAGLLHMGTYASAAARSQLAPLIVQRKGKRIAFLAYTYGTNGIPFSPPAIVDLIDTTRMAQDMLKARQTADAIVVAMHWGEEYRHEPSAEQRRLARFLHRHGATVVVGNHPHVVQPVWMVADSMGMVRFLCLYSLGNFVSAQRTYPRAGSAIVQFSLQFDEDGASIVEGSYTLTHVEHIRSAGAARYRVRPLERLLEVYFGSDYVRRYGALADRLFGRGWGVLEGVHLRPESYIKPIGVEGIELRSTIYSHLQR